MQMTVHYYSGKETNNVQILLQDTTNRITSWPDERGLNFNIEKRVFCTIYKNAVNVVYWIRDIKAESHLCLHWFESPLSHGDCSVDWFS